jgi:hypothetical protein
MKFTNTVTRIEFSEEDLTRALADYVDLEYNRPNLADKIRNKQFSISKHPNTPFSIEVKHKSKGD